MIDYNTKRAKRVNYKPSTQVLGAHRRDDMEKSQTAFQANVTDEQKSALQKYQDTVLGKSGWGYLIKYELIMLLCS